MGIHGISGEALLLVTFLPECIHAYSLLSASKDVFKLTSPATKKKYHFSVAECSETAWNSLCQEIQAEDFLKFMLR